MANKLQIALPLMLHNEGEVAAFKEAKPRIEERMAHYGKDAEVGAFIYMMDWSIRDPKMRAAQLETQKRERFSIYHAQAPIIGVNSLDLYGRSPDFARHEGCLLETSIHHIGDLARYSETRPDISVHTGTFVFPHADEGKVVGPGSYTVSEFQEKKDDVLLYVKWGFRDLNSLAQSKGLKILLENEPLANFEHGVIDGFKDAPHLIYKPFGTPDMMKKIAKYHVFDSNHFAATTVVLERLAQNGVDLDSFFAVQGLTQQSYDSITKSYNSFLHDNVRALHLSNTKGIGVGLKREEDIKNWGKDATNEGILSPEDFKLFFDYAQKRDISAVLEVDYGGGNPKRIPQTKYVEADSFLDYVFSS